MSNSNPEIEKNISAPPQKSKGQIYGDMAVSFCRAATVVLIAQKFALPILAGATAVFYGLALRENNRTVRCFRKYPWFIITFWSIVALVSLYLRLRQSLPR